MSSKRSRQICERERERERERENSIRRSIQVGWREFNDSFEK